MKWACLAGALVPCYVAMVAAASAADPDFGMAERRWSPWIEAGGYFGSGGTTRGEVALWAPLSQRGNGLLFLDARGKLFEGSFLEGNVALGGRAMLDGGWNLGLWAGYDARRTGTGNVFHQASFGAELLGDVIDLRANGYVPLSDPKASGTSEVYLSGNNIFMSGVFEVPLHGADAEVGVKLPLGKGVTLAAYGGGYWFDSPDIAEAISGPKARAELRLDDLAGMPGSRLTFEAEGSWDKVRGDRWEVGARLRIPLGGSASAGASGSQWARMAEAIERDTDIVVVGSGPEHVEDVLTGVDFNTVAIFSGGEGADVTTASTNLGANGLLVLDGDVIGGTTMFLEGNQTLLGAGTPLQVRGLASGTVGTFTYAGTRPSIEFTRGDGDNVNMSIAYLQGSNAHLAGADVWYTANAFGLYANPGQTNLVLRNLAIEAKGPVRAAIYLDRNSEVRVMDSEVVSTGSQPANGVYLVGEGQVHVSNTVIRDTNLAFRGAEGSNIAVDGVTVAAAQTVVGVQGSGTTLTFNNSRVAGANAAGFDVAYESTTFSGTGNSREGATFTGTFCDAGGNPGSLEFDGVVYSVANNNCPP